MTSEKLQEILIEADKGLLTIKKLAERYQEEPDEIAREIYNHDIKRRVYNGYFSNHPEIKNLLPISKTYDDYLRQAGYNPKKVKKYSQYCGLSGVFQ